MASETQQITFSNADSNAFYGLRAHGTAELAAFQTSATNSQYKSLTEGLAAYLGHTATYTGATLSGSALKSGTKTVNFDGNVDVPALEVVEGQREAFQINNGDTGNYSLNGGATFTLPITEADLQSNQRALSGRGGVVVKGVSSPSYAGTELLNSLGGSPFASSDRGAANGAGAFDGSSSTGAWVADGNDTGGNSGTEYVGWDLGAGKSAVVNRYTVRTFDFNPANNPLFDSWVLEASNNLTSWTALHSVDQHSALADATDYPFTFTNIIPYRAYRLRITGTVSNDPILGELYLYVAPSSGSASFTLYYPVDATPGNPTKSGTGAVVSKIVNAGALSSAVSVVTLQQGSAPAATISSVSLTEAQPGQKVTLTGQGFLAVTGVAFSGRPARQFQIISDTEILAVVPPL